MSRVWLVVLAVLLGTVVLATPAPESASAHALLERADPPPNSSIREPPTMLTLYFTEGLERRFSDVRVLDQTGARVDDGVEFDEADNKVMRVRLKPLSPGFITVAWENVSSVDGHRISGSYPITILNPDGSVPEGSPFAAGSQVSGASARPERVVTKTILLIAGCLLTGTFVFAARVSPGFRGDLAGRARDAVDRYGLRLAAAALLVLAVTGVVELILQARELDASVSDALDTTWGERWLWRNLVLLVPLGALLLARGALTARSPFAWAGALGSLAYLAITSSVSHGAAAGGAFWGGLSDFAHLAAASVWIGMLAMLVVVFIWTLRTATRGDRAEVLAPALQRFSEVAVVSLALLLFTGVVNTVIELGRLSDLVNTAYGRALLAKLLLLAPLLGLAAINAYLLRPRYVFEADYIRPRNRQRLEELEGQLMRGIRWEIGLALIVLAVVGLLVQITPTRGAAGSTQATGKFTDTAEGDGISATLVIDPNQPGTNTFEVYLAGAVDQVESVRLEFAAPESGEFGVSRLVMEPSKPPTFYVGRGAFLTEPGDWRVDVFLRRVTSDLTLPFEVRVAGPGGATPSAGGRGSLDLPFELTPVRTAAIVLSGVLAVGLVLGSRVRPELPGGYLAEVAEEAYDRFMPDTIRPAWSLAALLIIGVGLGVVLGSHLHGRLSPNQAASANNPIPSTEQSIERGRMLFMQSCIQCHGETGRGDGPLASSLPLQPANLYDHVPFHPDQYFYEVITRGLSGVMPAFSSLSEEDRWNIINYLRSQFGQPPPSQ
jgi:copper transport protein